jgi:V/A-type H+-transporting ATPase subunit F
VRFYCIADEDTVRGFRLAGVEGRVVTSAAQALAALEEAVSGAEHGLVILTHPVAAWIRAQVETLRTERDRPLVVEIPGPSGPLAGRKTLRQLVHSAVGMSLDQGKGR